MLASTLLSLALSGGIYLELINDSHDRVLSVEASPAGTQRWQALEVALPLGGGSDSATVRLQRDGCLYDLRIGFSRGPALLHPAYDACNGPRYRIGTYRRAAMRKPVP